MIYILIVILIIIIFYIWCNKRQIEKFGNNDDLKKAINEIYKADIEAIRNLSNYATYLMDGGTSNVKVPGTITATSTLTAPNVTASKELKIGNTTINEDQLKNLLAGKFTNLTTAGLTVTGEQIVFNRYNINKTDKGIWMVVPGQKSSMELKFVDGDNVGVYGVNSWGGNGMMTQI
jgi:hypothetical protein